MTNPPAKDPTIEQLTAASLLNLVYARLRLSVLLSVGVSLICAGLLASLFPTDRLVLGVLVIQAVGAGRYLLGSYYARSQLSDENFAFWHRAFVLGAVAAGASWAFGFVLLMPEAGRPETALLLVMILSVGSVAVASLAAQYPAMLGFLLAIVLPPIGSLVLSGGTVEGVAALFLVAALLCLAAVGRQSSAATRQLVRTEIELSRAMAEAAGARAAAEASSQTKSQFLANMSHEVRTPLTGILGTIEILGASALDEGQRRWVTVLRQSAQHLLKIVNAILDLSKIELGKLELEESEFDVITLLEDTAALMQPTVERAGLLFEIEIAPDMPRHVIADPLRLKQVLINLLSNAVKFTEDGFVALRARREPGSESNERVLLCFEVADSGIGIAPEDTARIFEAFTQVDESATRRFGGTGLGLAVCRRLTESMGDGIRIESKLGEGSTLRFTVRARLPTIAARAEVEATPPLAPRGPRGHSGRVLLAEDNPVSLEVAVAMLENLGVEVVCARDGLEAIEKLQECGFDLVLTDCQMPGMDGYAVTRALRTRNALDRRGRRLPIVGLSANAFDEDRRQALDAGMDDYVSKPASLAAIDGVLTRWLPPRTTR